MEADAEPACGRWRGRDRPVRRCWTEAPARPFHLAVTAGRAGNRGWLGPGQQKATRRRAGDGDSDGRPRAAASRARPPLAGPSPVSPARSRAVGSVARPAWAPPFRVRDSERALWRCRRPGSLSSLPGAKNALPGRPAMAAGLRLFCTRGPAGPSARARRQRQSRRPLSSAGPRRPNARARQLPPDLISASPLRLSSPRLLSASPLRVSSPPAETAAGNPFPPASAASPPASAASPAPRAWTTPKTWTRVGSCLL